MQRVVDLSTVHVRCIENNDQYILCLYQQCYFEITIKLDF